ncbi:hypothetical protein [Shewanella psychrotolerans]|uniref:hypothetical protein n=1 Tax=Shewanella psychrotolerans TaxID=2864206 RepID=UPI001C66191F|nr:hypothetical protein [Shewanella psychrotolerans]QYK03101.1 hypothetical protein K0I62_09370 [Shewanella psychrotolerans]
MDEQLNQAIELAKDIGHINEFLLKGIVVEDVQKRLTAHACVLLGRLDDTLIEIKEASCKSSNIKA